jgi:hypothetical protein
VSTLDEIRARLKTNDEARYTNLYDARDLLALLDAQSLELQAAQLANKHLHAAMDGDDQMMDALRAELQAVREALGRLVDATICECELMVRPPCPNCNGKAALKQSRGA